MRRKVNYQNAGQKAKKTWKSWLESNFRAIPINDLVH